MSGNEIEITPDRPAKTKVSKRFVMNGSLRFGTHTFHSKALEQFNRSFVTVAYDHWEDTNIDVVDEFMDVIITLDCQAVVL